MNSNIQRIADGKTKGYWLPSHIFYDNKLSINEVLLLVKINSLSQTEKGCFASNANFGKFLGLAESSINGALRSLENKGYIKRIESKLYKTGRLIEIKHPHDISLGYNDIQAAPPQCKGSTPTIDHNHNKEVNKEVNRVNDISIKKNHVQSNHLDLDSKVNYKNLTEKEKIERINAIYNALITDESWQNDLARITKVSPGENRRVIKLFIDEIKAKDDFYKSLRDLKIYCVNWIRIKIPAF